MQTFIRCASETVWDTLENEKEVANYHFMDVVGEREGETVHMRLPDGTSVLSSRLIRAKPKTEMECTFELHLDGSGAVSRVFYRMEPEGDHCILTIEHYDLDTPVISGEGVSEGWARWADGLKTWLETGRPVRFEKP
jgi:uncharacterized protein YndB with AHSA1/START domain